MKKITSLFVDNIYLILVFFGLMGMLGLPHYESGLMKIATILFVLNIFNIYYKPIDIVVFFYIVYCLFSSLWGDVSIDVFYDGIVTQLMPISFYFLSRVRYLKSNKLINNMYYPLMFAFISAIVLYFYMPQWYVNFKMQSWDIIYEGSAYYERMRLSGFWPWPYFLGCASLFFIMHEIVLPRSNILYFLSIMVAMTVLFLSQLRSPILYFLFFIILTFLVSERLDNKVKIKLKRIFIVILSLCIISFVLFYLLPPDLKSYFFDKSFNSNSNIIADRVFMFSKYLNTITLLGSGLGGYSHYAATLRLHSITDCDYLRIANEIGLLGIIILIFIIIYILILGIRKLKNNYFEVSVIGFLLTSMIGAAPLESTLLQPFFYWYCMGRIVSNSTFPNTKLSFKDIVSVISFRKFQNRRYYLRNA